MRCRTLAYAVLSLSINSESPGWIFHALPNVRDRPASSPHFSSHIGGSTLRTASRLWGNCEILRGDEKPQVDFRARQIDARGSRGIDARVRVHQAQNFPQLRASWSIFTK